MKARTQDDYIRTALRVPPELHARIHESAKAAGRTFNAEIVARLEESYSPNLLSKEAADGILKSQLLNFELAAQLSRYDIRKFELAAALMQHLFTSDPIIAKRIVKMADDGEPIASKAIKTATEGMLVLTEIVRVEAEKLAKTMREDEHDKPKPTKKAKTPKP